MGRFTRQCSKPLRVQALGAVPKKGSNALRPITDCSRPFSCSLNSFIVAEPFKFETIDDAVALAKPNCYFAVVDIKSAYRWVPIFPAHRQFQGFSWAFDNEPTFYYVDNFLCFGLANAPAIFQRISCAITRMIRRRGFNIVAYLDDFLLIAESQQECLVAVQSLLSILTNLGFSVKWEKLAGPTKRIQFLGLIIDSEAQCLELPEEKIRTLEQMIGVFLNRTKCSKRELQAPTGQMAFAGKVVFGARTFSRIFIDALSKLKRPTDHCRITRLLRAELE